MHSDVMIRSILRADARTVSIPMEISFACLSAMSARRRRSITVLA